MQQYENLISLPLERSVLSGLLKFKEIFPEIDSFLNENDFYNKNHQIIYSIVKSSYLKNERLDKTLLAQKILNLGISYFENDIPVIDYISSVYEMSQINEKGTILSVKELITLRIKREIIYTARKIRDYVVDSGNVSIDELIGTADSIYNNKISAYSLNDGPVEIFKDAEQIIEELGNNPIEISGVPSPFPKFNDIYGPFRNKNLSVIAARSGEGKTTMLSHIGLFTAINLNIPFLACDTEMSSEEIRMRNIAALSEVPLYYIETGKWRYDSDMTKKVRKILPTLSKIPFYHYHVKNKSMDEICAISRRWKYSKVGRDNQCLMSYDYFKLGNEKIGSGILETQVMGTKCDTYKRLLEDTNSPGLAAVQMNRDGENAHKTSATVFDSSSTLALSDRILWFSSQVILLRKKLFDELEKDGLQFGSHKGILLKCRTAGKFSPGHADFIKRKENKDDKKGKYIRNFINFDISNFRVTEKGTLQDIVNWENDQFNIQDSNKENNKDSVL